ncbi:hypothetical protein [Corynebacterium glyciniphilum]|uniref:hypothetical protein n=1 Tax=Corynebacterium glyciniphilum TaxID=1404244 RepID=UPI00264CC54A|nr:hypothetical protein [Corynebacterium glyciniphilum]MDN6706386.1 hypothetical protein [Corynebacterium glyciniphilum]
MSDTLIGSQEPNPEYSRFPRYHHTDGDDCAFLADGYGLTPDPWQKLFLDYALGQNAQDQWTATTAALSVPRQNGKNAIIEMIELFQLVSLGRKILHTAHQIRTSRAAFNRLCSFFENPNHPELTAYCESIRRTNGQEAIELTNGGAIYFSARSQGAARGLTVDTLVMDEAQDLGDETLAALMPTISAAPSGKPQRIVCGTPPTTKSEGETFTRIRESAQDKANRRILWFEWSADDNGMVDTSDPTVWASANPALGFRLQPDVIEDEVAAMEAGTFMRERLGMWNLGKGKQAALPLDDWKECADRDFRLQPEDVGTITLSIDVTPSRDSAAIVAAIQTTNDEPPVIDVIDQRAGDLYWVAPRVAQIVEERNVSAVVVDGYGPGASLITAMEDRGVGVTKINVGFVTTAAERLLDAVATQNLRHLDQGGLTAAVAGAVRRPIGKEGRFSFKRLNGETDISPLIAAMLALSALQEHSADLSPVKYRRKRPNAMGQPYKRKVVVM